MPVNFSDFKARVSANRSTLSFLAVVFVAAFVGMVVSSYCANHIEKSKCWSSGSVDDDLRTAYKWSWTSATLEGLIVLGTIIGMVWVVGKSDRGI